MSEPRSGGDRWQQVSRLFDEAIELPPERRADFLREATGDDEPLRRELETLLTAADTSETFLTQPAKPTPEAGPEPETLAPDTRLGAWRIERLLGRGGMGEVYLAARADGRYEQRAAIKLLQSEATAPDGATSDDDEQPPAAGREAASRFEEECRILARLEHPGIARLYDAGRAPDGRPYMVMEYVVGQPLGAWLRSHRPDLGERLRLFLEICAAVAYAHANLVVHRDLKPANILVTADGRAKLLDFGVGKLLEADGSTVATLTAVGLTPEYAAPEQLTGQPVTTATDIYALGVLLYELLTGRRPWAGEHVARILHALLHEEPPSPRADAVEQNAPPVPPRLLRGDLEAIVAKCLRKEPQHRYGTVNGLALDIRRHLDGDPVAARSGARLYVLGRTLRRHRLAVAATLALVTALGAGLAGTLWQASVARRQAEEARRESRRAEASRDFLAELFGAVDPDVARGDIPNALDLLDEGARRVRQGAFGETPELRSAMLDQLGDLYRKIGRYEAARPLLTEALELAEAGGDPTRRAEILFHLGTLEVESGDHDRALASLERAESVLAEAEQVPGTLHSLVTQHTMVTLIESGRTDEAVKRTRAALTRARSATEIESEALHHYLLAHGGALLEAERPERAAPLLEEALALEVTSADAPSSRLVLHTQLAAVRRAEGKREAAVDHLRAVVELADQVYPPVHRERAQALNNLASGVLALGRHDEAVTALRESLDILYELYPDGRHIGIAVSHNNLGLTLADAGRDEEAEPHLRRARDLGGELLGRDDPRYARSCANLALLATRLGNYGEADELLQEALGIYRAALGPEHPLVGLTLGGVTSLRLAEGRPAEALRLSEQMLALYRRAGNENPASRLSALGFRARALAGLERDEEAEAAFEEALALREGSVDDAPRQWSRLLSEYAEFLVERNAEKAPDIVSRALEFNRRAFGDDHPATRRLDAMARDLGLVPAPDRDL